MSAISRKLPFQIGGEIKLFKNKTKQTNRQKPWAKAVHSSHANTAVDIKGITYTEECQCLVSWVPGSCANQDTGNAE